MDNNNKLDILAIAAHPDDVEITCGGLLIKMGKKGRTTGVVDLTRGEAGTLGTAEDRETEFLEATKILGLAYRTNLNLGDSAVELNHGNKLKIAAKIRETRPDLVILPHWEQRHPDHRVCSTLGYDACFLAGLKKAPLNGDPHRPRKIIYATYYRNTDFSFMVDISEEFEQKCLAIGAYKSQFGNEGGVPMIKALTGEINLQDVFSIGPKNIFAPGTSIFDLLFTRAHQLGQLVGVQFAEAYTIKEHILIDDPLSLSVRSI